MNLVELHEGNVTDKVHVGDTVLIRGTVVKVQPGVGVLAELFSKTDQYEAWIALDKVAALVLADVAAEPGNGSWVVGDDNNAVQPGSVNVFRRDDANAPDEPDRRWPRRWQVAGTGEWVDWPTAVERGADPTRPLYALAARPPVEPLPANAQGWVRDMLRNRASGVTTIQIISWGHLRRRLPKVEDGKAVKASDRELCDRVEEYLEQLASAGLVTHHPARYGRQPYWTWNTTS